MKATAYIPPLDRAQPISPSATSKSPAASAVGEHGVVQLGVLHPGKEFLYVESITAPFIAEVASSAGATKLVYPMTGPLGSGEPSRPDGPARLQSRAGRTRLEETGHRAGQAVPVDPGVPFDQVRTAPATEACWPGHQRRGRQDPQRQRLRPAGQASTSARRSADLHRPRPPSRPADSRHARRRNQTEPCRD